jgi:hypothetical protein
MNAQVVALPSYDELREFVRLALCERDRLDPAQATFRQARIRRGDRTCGLFFQAQGPHQQRAYAVWSGDEHRLLFYDAAGNRFREVRLSEAPDPEACDTRAA